MGQASNTYSEAVCTNRSQGVHRTRRTSPKATWGQLDAAIDTLGELVKKYRLLLTQQSLMTLEPVIQENWRSVFAVPWYTAK